MKSFLQILSIAAGMLCCSSKGFTQTNHQFTLSKEDFLLDGKPFRIISGEMHPARIPREYWLHRILMAKAMGCNTIAVYIFWNYHEQIPGQFDFRSGNHDIGAFIDLCRKEGLWVLLRPGPYVCAEWDLGGLPSWLLKNPGIRLRCMDSIYIHAVKKYIDRLSGEIKPRLCTRGGPIIMLQIENEYGSFGNDKQYLEELRKFWLNNGIDIPFYTADGPTAALLEAGSLDGAVIGLDSGSSEADFERAKKRNPGRPAFSSETYTGWLTHWGEKWARNDTNQLKKELTWLLENNKSFNLYLVHGGTNFGFTAGANAFSPTQFQPDVTSYDYDAPINEQGRATPKYFMIRNLVAKYSGQRLPDIPTPIETITIPPVQLIYSNTIWNNMGRYVRSIQPRPIEEFDQGQGLVIYRTELVGHKGGKLTIREPHDYALVFLNHRFIDTVFRDGGKWTIDLPAPDVNVINPILEILVEAMGHINYGEFMPDRKGITERVTLNGMTLMNWEIFLLPMDAAFIEKEGYGQSRGISNNKQGLFFWGRFNLEKTGDTYFDLSHFSKGMIYINGHNLGRYWNLGPQQRLYCPAGWLKKGENQVIVFDLHRLEGEMIRGMPEPD